MNQKTEDLIARVVAKASEVADYTVKKTGEVVSATKLSYKLMETNNAVSACESAIGRIVYAAHRGEDADQEALEQNLEKLDALHAEAEELRKKIDAGKRRKTCPACGRACPHADRYCAGCGAEI